MSLIKNRQIDMCGSLMLWIEIDSTECIIAHVPKELRNASDEVLEVWVTGVRETLLEARNNQTPVLPGN